MKARDVPLRVQLGIFGITAALGAVLSAGSFHFRLRALRAGGRDLGFFMAEYQRLLDVPVWRGLAAEPSGNDAFGFAGIDGVPTLHHDIHCSPLKYVLALVRLATGSWAAVQLALVATVLAGLGYALARLHRVGGGHPLAVAAFGVLTVSPLFALGTCHDLRPSVALGAFVVALAAALATQAPSRHLAVLALLGLLVREEAAVLLALASFWLMADGREHDGRRLYAMALAYALAFHALYLGALPFRYAPHAPIALVWLSFALTPAFLVLPERARGVVRAVHARHRTTTVLLLGVPFVAVLGDPFFNGHLVRSALARAFPAALVAALVITHRLLSAGVSTRDAALLLSAVAFVPALGASLFELRSLARDAERGEAVWSLAERLPRERAVLTDFAHYQAFAGRDRLLVWERLPTALEPPDRPDAPQGRPALLATLRHTDALWVLSPRSFDTLLGVLARHGEADAIERCAGATAFVVAHRRDGRTPCPWP